MILSQKILDAHVTYTRLRHLFSLLKGGFWHFYVVVCNCFMLTRTLGIDSVDLLSWKPRHSFKGCCVTLWGNSDLTLTG